MGVVHMMEPQEEVVGSRLRPFEIGGNLGGVHSRIACSVPYSAIHTYREAVCAGPLSPTVPVLRLRLGAVVGVKDVRQGLDPQVSRVVFIGGPRLHRHVSNSLNDIPAGPESK